MSDSNVPVSGPAASGATGGREAAQSEPPRWIHRTWILLGTLATTALAATACSSPTSTVETTTPAAVAADAPWLGAFEAAGLPTPVNSLTALDCITATACWAVGSTVGGGGAPNGAALIATTNGGSTWTAQIVPTTVGYLSGIACSDQRHCVAVGQASSTSNGEATIIATSNRGATWTSVATPPGLLDLTAVTCRPNHGCIAIGSTAGLVTSLVSTSPASGWVQRGNLPAGITGATDISCADVQHCWVTAHSAPDADHVVGAVALTTDGGATWKTAATPKGAGYLNGVSCIDGSIEGSGALPLASTTTEPTTSTTAPAPSTTTTEAPAPTTTEPPPTTTTTTTIPIVGVAGVRCTVVGTTAGTLSGTRTGHGLILTTDNGGASWSNQTVPSTAASLLDISCTAIGSCITVGSSVATAPQAGVAILTGSTDRPWRHSDAVGLPLPLSAVSCVSYASCVVVGESISEHLSGG